MANTTFNGPVRSENGFKSISKDGDTGAITEITTYGGAPVSLSDGDVTLTNATHSGRVLLVPDGTTLIRCQHLLPVLCSALFTQAVQQMLRTQSLSLPATLISILVVLLS